MSFKNLKLMLPVLVGPIRIGQKTLFVTLMGPEDIQEM